MARGTVNRVILVGRLGADPELRYTPGGAAVCNFRIATNEVWKDSEGEWQERTEWHNIVAWRELAERCGEQLRKGARIYIEGRLQTREWEGRDGVKRRTTEIVAQRMQMMDRRAVEPVEEAPLMPEEEGSGEEDDLPF